MNKTVIVAALLIVLAGCRGALNDKAPPSVAEPNKPETTEATTPESAEHARNLLFHLATPAFAPGGEGGQPDPLQQMPVPARGTQPEGWNFDPVLDMSGKMPSDDAVRNAIVKAVNFVLDSQHEDGSWDVELTGTILSNTADDAVDAIAATGLAGVALRYHVKVNPARIEPALRKAAEYVIDRVYRGKLPIAVWYANWRYTLGLKLLYGEYMATTDEEFKEDIIAVCRRMVNSMMRLQRSKSAPPLLEQKRRARLSSRAKRNATPSTLGVVLFPPTDTDYRGGALIERVLPGSQAEQAGLKPGMRITKAESLTIENALDYYQLESEWVGGQSVRIHVKSESGAVEMKNIKLLMQWPGYLGLKMSPSIGEGPIVADFLPFSPARDKLEKGDVITEVNGTEVKTLEEFQKVLATELKPGDRVRLKTLSGERKRRGSATISASAAPEGTFWIFPEDEDKESDGGIVVAPFRRPSSPAQEAGIEEGDRIIRIGDTPIIGYDHYVDFLGTVPAGASYKIIWVRNGEEMQADIVASPTPQPFELGFDARPNPNPMEPTWEAVVTMVDPRGPAKRAGLQVGDKILALNGVVTPDFWDFVRAFYDLQISAGEFITLKVQRGRNEHEVTYELPKRDITGDEEEVEEGGWYYYPQYNDAPSFATASAVLVLKDIDDNIREIKIPRHSMRAAAAFLTNLRINDSDNGNQETYLYSSDGKDPRAKPRGLQNLRGCQGRNCICELALYRLGARQKVHVSRMVDQFLTHRHELDRVRGMEYYVSRQFGGSPHCMDYFANAAYYWLYGHYHALLAAKTVSRRAGERMGEICVRALMQTRGDDGLWLGHPSFGKLCGTSEALWILGETDGGWRDGYEQPGPTTQPGESE